MESKYFGLNFVVIIIVFMSSCSPKVSKIGVSEQLNLGQYEGSIKSYRDKNEKDFVLYNADKPSFSSDDFKSKLDYYPIDIAYKCTCNLQLSIEKQMVEMSTYAGTTKLYTEYGIANCQLKGKEIILSLFKQVGAQPIYQNLLFLPIKDLTSGDGSYGGGRYLNLDINEIVGDVITIDFNKAYNPWCAYSGGFTCPIPPKENHLMLEVLAGEKDFGGH